MTFLRILPKFILSNKKRITISGAINGTQLVLLQCLNPAVSFSTTSVGGGRSANVCRSTIQNEIFFKMAANQSGGGNLVQYGKSFIGNTSSTGPASDINCYIENAGIPLTELDYPYAVCTAGLYSTGESTSKLIRFIGSNGNPLQADVGLLLNSMTPTYSPEGFSGMTRAVLLNQSDQSSAVADNDIEIFHGGGIKGIIPQGLSCCNWDMAAGLGVSGINDMTTIATAAVAPAGVSFSAPSSDDDAFNIPILPPGEAMALWWRWTLPELIAGTKFVDISVILDADDGTG